MRVLVSGGAGYIGGFVTRLLARSGHHPVVADDLSTGHRSAIPGVELIEIDVRDREGMRDLLGEQRIDAVMHFAGLKSVARSWLEPDRYHSVNVEGTSALLAAMIEAGVGRLIYSSTCAVYGNPESVPIAESHPTRPMNPYGASKLRAEQAIQDASNRSGIQFCALRFFNAAGAEFDGSAGELLSDAENILPIIFKAALGRVPQVPIYGTDYPTPDGTAVRDYVHVLDLAEAHLLALGYLQRGGASTILNLGTGRGTSVRELIASTERCVRTQLPARDSDRREGDPAEVFADPSLAHEVLGWRARFGIDEIVASAWAWHQRHPAGYG